MSCTLCSSSTCLCKQWLFVMSSTHRSRLYGWKALHRCLHVHFSAMEVNIVLAHNCQFIGKHESVGFRCGLTLQLGPGTCYIWHKLLHFLSVLSFQQFSFCCAFPLAYLYYYKWFHSAISYKGTHDMNISLGLSGRILLFKFKKFLHDSSSKEASLLPIYYWVWMVQLYLICFSNLGVVCMNWKMVLC